MATATRLKIGEISQPTGVTVGAWRYSESLGLIQAERGETSYRDYPPETMQQIQVIPKAQTLGFSLENIGAVLHVPHQGDEPCEFVQSLLPDKAPPPEAQRQAIVAGKTALEQHRDSWVPNLPHPQPGDICPLLANVPLNA